MDNKENEPCEIISLDAVTEFLVKNNGKVKQADLINHFRCQLNSPTTKARARQEFKDILQLITAVKTEKGEKYIVLIKQSQEHSQALVTNRIHSRTLAQRKELARSKYDSLQIPTPPSLSDEEDSTPNHHGSAATLSNHHGSAATLSNHSHDSGIGSESSSIRSVASLRSVLSNKVVGTHSMDSISTVLTDGDGGDLEDDLGLTGTVEVLPEEKDWMLASAHGKLDHLKKLLETHPSLVKKKDFLLSALHWAAKLGRADIVRFITSNGGDITAKSGYTPLHLAAISGKDQVIIQLIECYGANIHARDNSGRKPKDLVKDTVAGDVQRKLGRSLILEPDHMLDLNHLTVPRASPNIGHNSRHHSLPRLGSHSDSDTSPKSTPELGRKHLKSISAQAKRSMSFLGGKKKKHDHRLNRPDIQHSAHIERRGRHASSGDETDSRHFIQTLPTDTSRLKPRIDSQRNSEKSRPKSQVLSAPEIDFDAQLRQSSLSFEI